MTTPLSSPEQWMLQSVLRRRHAEVAKQRAITERNLAEGWPDTEVLNRLAYHEECELATLDSLAAKLLPGWMR